MTHETLVHIWRLYYTPQYQKQLIWSSRPKWYEMRFNFAEINNKDSTHFNSQKMLIGFLHNAQDVSSFLFAAENFPGDFLLRITWALVLDKCLAAASVADSPQNFARSSNVDLVLLLLKSGEINDLSQSSLGSMIVFIAVTSPVPFILLRRKYSWNVFPLRLPGWSDDIRQE